MTESDDRGTQAEERTEETRSFLRRVRAVTRRKYTPEEKIRIVLEGFRREVTVSDLCRREGVKPGAYYAWTRRCSEKLSTGGGGTTRRFEMPSNNGPRHHDSLLSNCPTIADTQHVRPLWALRPSFLW